MNSFPALVCSRISEQIQYKVCKSVCVYVNCACACNMYMVYMYMHMECFWMSTKVFEQLLHGTTISSLHDFSVYPMYSIVK